MCIRVCRLMPYIHRLRTGGVVWCVCVCVCAKSNSWNNGNARHWASVNLGDPVRREISIDVSVRICCLCRTLALLAFYRLTCSLSCLTCRCCPSCFASRCSFLSAIACDYFFSFLVCLLFLSLIFLLVLLLFL